MYPMQLYGESIVTLLNSIVNFINNRDIYIISSGVPLDGVEFDVPVLVRLNSSRRWGDCDIWFNNQSQDPKFQRDSRGSGEERFIIRANGDNEGANMRRNYPEEFLPHTYFWSVHAWKEMTQTMNIARPLTGTIAAYWFHQHTESNIFLINYDFYENNKVHTVRGIPQPAPVHKPWLDKEYLQSLDRIEFKWVIK